VSCDTTSASERELVSRAVALKKDQPLPPPGSPDAGGGLGDDEG
jgi:hypothetical protein